ncbi:hypothetical protein IscW_ISCW023797 [Ixodes scapularis]|uniref:Uncharacterized protein n=1 Tax=Ixodes scapularis TaxID=6945 RepID=B7QHJ9_IXOSC|nr:hypothetical protein IscW_ISCW023797 [Ixodes scapularis]|eukprot:XP_002414656.1 hypothetical protein IscW_ISCW023797 [Ixodes scapularis]
MRVAKSMTDSRAMGVPQDWIHWGRVYGLGVGCGDSYGSQNWSYGDWSSNDRCWTVAIAMPMTISGSMSEVAGVCDGQKPQKVCENLRGNAST